MWLCGGFMLLPVWCSSVSSSSPGARNGELSQIVDGGSSDQCREEV